MHGEDEYRHLMQCKTQGVHEERRRPAFSLLSVVRSLFYRHHLAWYSCDTHVSPSTTCSTLDDDASSTWIWIYNTNRASRQNPQHNLDNQTPPSHPHSYHRSNTTAPQSITHHTPRAKYTTITRNEKRRGEATRTDPRAPRHRHRDGDDDDDKVESL